MNFCNELIIQHEISYEHNKETDDPVAGDAGTDGL